MVHIKEFMCRKYTYLLVAILLMCSCASNRLVIFCEPHNAHIYVDDKYVGTGIAHCKIPKYKDEVTFACSTDNVIFAYCTLQTKDLGKILNLYLTEELLYSTDKINF